MPAEKAHHFSTATFKFLCSIPIVNLLINRIFHYEDPKLEKTICGIRFPNPVGLAAGFDKDGKYYKTMSKLGFGFIEIGTVTPLSQDGNPKPRLFRLSKDASLINRMGFNNEGVDAMISRIAGDKKRKLIIGGNIGKNKITPNEQAVDDYEICFTKLYPYVDYFVINVSSPNTPDLRSLQDKEPLTRLLAHIMDLRDRQAVSKPVFLKIAPDLNHTQIDDVLSILKSLKVDGIIATNTTISRQGLKTKRSVVENIGSGGLSGQALTQMSLDTVRYIRSKNATLPIIGVGGISNPMDAGIMLAAGADLVQVYSGLIYQGPLFIKKIKKHLSSVI
jgi:dihydroorotate dehydrogenase